MGNQTSTLMSESVEGVRVTVTRQKAGKVENCAATETGPPGVASLKVPAATVFADVIVVSGNLNEARPSHEAAKTDDAVRQNVANVINIRILLGITIPPPTLIKIWASPLNGKCTPGALRKSPVDLAAILFPFRSAAVQPRTETRNDSAAAPARRLFRNRGYQRCPRPWRREPVDATGS